MTDAELDAIEAKIARYLAGAERVIDDPSSLDMVTAFDAQELAEESTALVAEVRRLRWIVAACEKPPP